VQGFQYTMAFFAMLSIGMFIACFATTRERVTPPPAQKSDLKADLGTLVRNWPWFTLLLASIFSTTFIAMRSGSTLFYFKYVVGADDTPILFGKLDSATVFITSNAACQMLGALCLSFFVRLADKRVLATILSVITAVCYSSFYFLPTDNYGLLLAVNAFGSFCMGPTSALVWAMYGDVADFGEWKYGRRATGLVYSASLFALKTGLLVGGFLLPKLLEWFGFVRDVEQTPEAIWGILVAFSAAPGIFALLKAVFLWIYPLSQRKMDEIENTLAARREAEGTSASA
jgi:GPH family glycoside/pentoside/hexuronide:cation symporter